MKWYNKKWWKSVVGAKEERKEDALKDINAIVDFLEEITDDSKVLLKNFKKLQELEKERKFTSAKIIHINLEAQEELLDKLIERYGFFQNDVDISGLKLKRVAEQFLRNAKSAGLTQIVKDKERDMRWRFQF